MARPGRPRKPLQLIAGHRTKAELAEREHDVKANPVAPKRPAGLTRYERECWDLHAPELDRLGLLTVLDAGSFRQLCATYGLALECLEAMRPAKSDGTPDRRSHRLVVLVSDAKGGGQKRHPALGAYLMAAREYSRWCGEFGLTPSSRVGLRTGAPIGTVPDEDDDDAAFFGS